MAMSYRQEKQGLLFLDKVVPFGMRTVFCGLFRVTKTLFFGRGAAVGFSKCYSIKWKKKGYVNVACLYIPSGESQDSTLI